MKQNDLPVALDRIRIDGGTQVREQLNDAWVRELRELFDDGVDVAPVLVFQDPNDVLWLVDGFHRYEARRRGNFGDIYVHVEKGTLEDAKLRAAKLSALGSLPRTGGDKKRAVLLALETTYGKSLGVRELARWCGVSAGYCSKVIEARDDVFPRKQCQNAISLPPAKPLPPTAGPREILQARIEAVIRADVNRSNKDIAGEVHCSERTVAERRKALGLPPAPRGGKKPETTATSRRRERGPALWAKIDAALHEDRDRSNADIGRALGISKHAVANRRRAMGLPPSKARASGGSSLRIVRGDGQVISAKVRLFQRDIEATLSAHEETELLEWLSRRHATREDRKPRRGNGE